MRHPLLRSAVVSLALTLACGLAATAAAGPIEPLPGFYEAENRFAFTGPSPAGMYVVGQGSVDMTFYKMVGMPQDELAILYDVYLEVGPYWGHVNLVTPQVTIDGFHNSNADEDDEQSWEIQNLTWDIVGGQGPNGNLRRIRLKFQVIIQGEHSRLKRLGYYYFARGRVLGPDGVAEPGPIKPQGGLG